MRRRRDCLSVFGRLEEREKRGEVPNAAQRKEKGRKSRRLRFIPGLLAAARKGKNCGRQAGSSWKKVAVLVSSFSCFANWKGDWLRKKRREGEVHSSSLSLFSNGGGGGKGTGGACLAKKGVVSAMASSIMGPKRGREGNIAGGKRAEDALISKRFGREGGRRYSDWPGPRVHFARNGGASIQLLSVDGGGKGGRRLP